MAIFRKIHTSFWSDSFIQDLDKDQKLFYIYLLTNERTRQCGVYEITKKQMSYDLGYSIDTVSILLKYFISKGKIKYNEDTKELAIGNWLKFNNSTSITVQTCINKEFSYVKDTLLIEYVQSMDTHSQEEEEKEKEKENNKEGIPNFENQNSVINVFEVEILKDEPEKEKRKKVAPKKEKRFDDFSEEVRECTKKCSSYFDKHLKPKTDAEWIAWLEVVEKLNKEGLVLEVIEEIVKETRADEFWGKNFLSLRKLTKKNKENVPYYVVFSELINAKNSKYGKSKKFEDDLAEVIKQRYGNA